MRYVVCQFMLLYCSFVCGQNADVDVSIHQIDETLAFYIINHSDLRQEVTLTISAQGLLGYKQPVTKLVPANDSIHMIALSFVKEKPWSYETSFSYRSVPTKEEIVRQNETIKKELFKHLEVRTGQPILFYKEGCTRSMYAKEALDRKNIRYKFLNVTKIPHYEKVLFELLRIQNPDAETFLYPVFLIDGKLNYSMDNLKWFMRGLTSKKR
ncbi:hypothetical protein [Flagellimonas onchidii]|uniref:hypothetical protein n=1 Tax=Flagellimonas onchidii TaxID=2562684 RepID=UPI0010A655C0|nr:hypothetical protein [Allomuricauda onchidii]